MSREYRTVSFNPIVGQNRASGEEVAKQMGDLISQGAAQGWVFQSYENIQITVNPGCLNFMSGQRTAHFGVLVFFRDR